MLEMYEALALNAKMLQMSNELTDYGTMCARARYYCALKANHTGKTFDYVWV